jgi:RimJ/RimL family protein N-acetyltransferase
MKLNTINIEEYNNKSISHRTLAMNIANDPLTRSTFYDFNNYIVKVQSGSCVNKVYVCSKDGRNIGIITLELLDSKYELSYAIDSNARGYEYEETILNEVSEYLLHKKGLFPLYLLIKPDNQISKVVASRSGYKKVDNTNNYIRNI